MLLAIDTSGPICAAALYAESGIVDQFSHNIGRGHAEQLMPMLEDLLATNDLVWSHITKVASTVGPGSFTGLRVGLATARGLALALNCPCVGVSVFQAFAHECGGAVAVIMDAKRDQVWMQLCNADDRWFGEPIAVQQSDALDQIPADITRITGSAISILSPDSKRFELLSDQPSPPIASVAHVANDLDAHSSPPVPLYLRAPDAKRQAFAGLGL